MLGFSLLFQEYSEDKRKGLVQELFAQSSIDQHKRPQELTLHDFEIICNVYKKLTTPVNEF